jgi:DNA-binding MarR family transcriptional regulator
VDPPPLDPILHQAQRLRIMTVLFRNRELAVATIKRQLGLTDGNLASHLTRLEEAGYVKTGHVLVGVSFEVHAKITSPGSQAFRSYLGALRTILEQVPDALEPSVPETAGAGVVDLGREHVP